MSNLAKLKAERTVIKSQLTRNANFLEQMTETVGKEEVAARLQKLEELFTRFEDIQISIELKENLEEDEEERSAFETKYYRAVGLARAALAPPPLPRANNQSQDREGAASRIKLPTIDLGKFDGSYEAWLPFHDSFTALIHNNASLADIQKFHYLKSPLTGPASQVIESLETTAANYSEAWKLLKKRFENKRLMIHNHVQALFAMPAVPKESASQIRTLLDNFLKHLRALKTLGLPTVEWDYRTLHLLNSKLDAATRRKWESSISGQEVPKFEELTDFISKHSAMLETLQSAKPAFPITNNPPNRKNEQSAVHVTTTRTCPICQDNHVIFNCANFKGMRVQQRVERVKQSRLCFNCLRAQHTAERCTAGGCKRCGKKHSTFLHFEEFPSGSMSNDQANLKENDTNQANSGSETSSSKPESNTLVRHVVESRARHLLSTAQIIIYDKVGKPHLRRALLDNGSQANLMTKALCRKLQLTVQKTNVSLSMVGKARSNTVEAADATIKSRTNEFKVKLPFLILDEITEYLPSSKVNMREILIPENIQLADASFHTPGGIDLLLGVEIFWELLCVGQFKVTDSRLALQKNKLGWIVAGRLPAEQKRRNSSEPTETVYCNFVSLKELHDSLERWWLADEYKPARKYSSEERLCEEDFVATRPTDETGRFIVSLPFRDSVDKLGNSRDQALARLEALLKRLDRRPEFRQQYEDFMNLYLEQGHMTEVREEHNDESRFRHYIPHHGVINEASTTTKLRVVFDASAKTSSGVSLNEILRVGPTIQDTLFKIMSRFRQHQFAMIADIAQMYRQVLLTEEHRDLQRILWRTSSDQPIKEYRLNTVTYGMAPSAFLAIRCLHQVAENNRIQHPEIAEVITRNFYVDDYIGGSGTIESARALKKGLQEALLEHGFPLRKWAANAPEILEEENRREGTATEISIGEVIKTLGLYWNPTSDVFFYKVRTDINMKVTKRGVLSAISQLYDPPGLVSPACIKAKIILQELWKLKTSSDESLPSDLHTTWIQYYRQLSAISAITIPRRVTCPNPIRTELHGFCDASERAYGACIYIRSVNAAQEYTARLHSAKARVAPLKVLSLPRLELCGAVILARLIQEVATALTIPINETYYWSDSQVTLEWVRGEPVKWKTFVASRVAEIQELSNKARWNHVGSKDNPADVISRGLNPELLQDCQLWWTGPSWLSQASDDSTESPIVLTQEITKVIQVEARKLESTGIHMQVEYFDLLDRFSSLSRLRRVVAYCLRFSYNAKNPTQRKESYSTVAELDEALTTIIKINQRKAFAREVKDLENQRTPHKDSKLSTLNPYMDEAGIVRVGGRLRNAEVPMGQKFPIVLSSKSYLTELIIRDAHLKIFMQVFKPC